MDQTYYLQPIFSCLHRRQLVVKFGPNVDWFYNADPNSSRCAVLLDKINLSEAMEFVVLLVAQGIASKKTIGPIAQYSIPCLIRNTLNPIAPGTLISHESK